MGNNILAESSGQGAESGEDEFFVGLAQNVFGGGGGYVSVLQAYCDESGTHEGAPLTCVGGYVFEKDKAIEFTQRWADKLRPFRGQGVRYFHASTCAANERPFSKLTAAERDALFGDLVTTIRETVKFGFAVAVEGTIFDDMYKTAPGWASMYGSKYTVCAQRSMALVGAWADQNKVTDRIAYFFESGNEFAKEAGQMMQFIADTPVLCDRYRYGGHGFYPKDGGVLPLQAADLLVWAWQQGFNKQGLTPILRNLFRKPGEKPHYVLHLTAESISVQHMINLFYGEEE